jgi:hypothetical protein
MLSDTSKVMWSRFGFYQLIITIIHGDKHISAAPDKEITVQSTYDPIKGSIDRSQNRP